MKTPYNYQNIAINKALKHSRFMMALDMGLGKTFSALMWLKKVKELKNNYKNTVILCDSKKIKDWEKEARELNFDNVIAIDKTKDNGLFYDINKTSNNIYILSYARFRRLMDDPRVFTIETFFNLIVDESQILKDYKSKITKILFAKSILISELLLLSGDPISTGYQNLYPQMKLLKLFRDDYKYNEFLFTYCKIFFLPRKSFPIINGYKNIDELMEILKERAFFLKTEEAVELPEKIAVEKVIEANKFYKDFKRDKALITKDFSIDATTIIKYFHILRMLASGVLKLDNETDEDKKYVKVSDAKFEELEILINESVYSFSIFYNYKAELYFIKKLMEKLNIKVFEINGAKNELEEALSYEGRFVVLINYQSGARGIDGLQNKVFNQVYFSLPYSGEMFRQSLKRVHRIGQNNKVFYYFLNAKNTIEKNIAKSLKNSQDYSMELFKKDFEIDLTDFKE